GILLWRRVAALEHERRYQLGMLFHLKARGPEIEQNRRSIVGADHDVLWRDVEMPGAVGVHQLKGIQQRSADEIELLLCRWAVQSLQPLLERASLDKIQQHVSGFVALKHAPHVNDVGVSELRQEPRLVIEFAQPPLVVGLTIGLGGK